MPAIFLDEMMKQRMIFFAALACLGLGTGCILVDREDRGTFRQATLGQELMDIQAAWDAGALSESEYQAQRRKLLSR